MKIKEIFPVNPYYADNYFGFVSLGKDFVKDKNIVFSILARNIEDKIEQNISALSKIGELFNSYKFVIYENDSNDNTAKILEEYNARENFHCTTEIKDREHFGSVATKERTLHLAEYRNKNLEVIKDNFSDTDYTIVCDIDFTEVDEEGILHSFGLLSINEQSAIAGASYCFKDFGNNNVGLWCFDSWAYRQNWWEDINYVRNSYTNHYAMLWYNFMILPRGISPYQVYSAFGGMAIYKTSDYIKGKYNGEDCEHVTFHKSLYDSIENFSLIYNPSQIMMLPDNS